MKNLQSIRVVAFLVLLFTIVATGVEGNWEEQETLLTYLIDSGDINQEMAELLRTNCKIELLYARKTLKDLELHLMDMEARSIGKLSRKEMRGIISALHLQVKQILLNCLREKGFTHPERTWYSSFLGFLFTQSTPSRRRELAELSGAAPAPSPEVSSPSPASTPQMIPASPPLLPFFPRVNDSNLEPTPGERPSDVQSRNNETNKRTVIIAVVVTASVTFVFAAFVFFFWRRCCGSGSGRRNDERPLLSLSLSDYSIASSHKMFNTVNEEKLGGNLSLNNKLNHNTNSGNYYMESHTLSNSKLNIPAGNKVRPANNSMENAGPTPPGSSGTPVLQQLTPPPGKANLPPVPTPLPKNATPPPPPLPAKPSSGGRRPPPPPVPSGMKAGPRPPPPPPAPGPGAPPPRPPPGGLKPPRPNNPSTSTSVEDGEAGGPKTKLKPFFWDKVLANPNDSMVWNQIKSGSFQFDEEMIESLFGYAPAGKNKNEGKKESTSQDPSTQYVKLIDPKKAQNLAIMLKALNVTTEEVCDALVEGNELPSELIESLLKMAPTTDEELKLRLYNGEISQLGPAERFLKVLVNIPFAFKRLECLLFMCTLQEETSSLKESFTVLEAACTELRKNRLFLKLLEAVLKTGNRMNDGTFRGGAQAFKLDTLLKLADVKGTDGKTTLLHFVVQEIIRSEGKRAAKETRSMWSEDFSEDSDEQLRSLGLQVVSGLGNELENVKRAASLDPDILTGTVANLGHALIKARDFLNSDMKSVEAENGFNQILRSFVQNAEVDVMWLLEEEKRIMALVKSTADYFHGNSGKDEGLRLFVVVRDFLIILDKVCREVKNAPRKMNRAEKKEEAVAVSSDPRQTNMVDPRQRLFPAIKDRRVNSSSSDEDE